MEAANYNAWSPNKGANSARCLEILTGGKLFASGRLAIQVSTLARSIGREIDLLLETSDAETVIGRATGMTITVEVVVVNRSNAS